MLTFAPKLTFQNENVGEAASDQASQVGSFSVLSSYVKPFFAEVRRIIISLFHDLVSLLGFSAGNFSSHERIPRHQDWPSSTVAKYRSAKQTPKKSHLAMFFVKIQWLIGRALARVFFGRNSSDAIEIFLEFSRWACNTERLFQSTTTSTT